MNRPNAPAEDPAPEQQPPQAHHQQLPQPLPRPHVRRMRWPFPLIWIVPLLAALATAYFFYQQHKDDGPSISLTLLDATGLRPGDSPVSFRGVQIGTLSSLDLDPANHHILAHVRLRDSANDFAKSGATFWVVRPEISIQSVSGLGTVLTGPYIEARPGSGTPTHEFTALPKPPPAHQQGLTVLLHAQSLDRLQVDSPVYYRGVQVGSVRAIRLAPDASHVDVHAFIRAPYAPIVRANSRFWAVAAADVKAGLFRGVELKLGSLRTLLSGGVAFATPDEGIGPPAADGEQFTLHPEPDKDWLQWTPHIPLAPDNAPDNDE